MLVCDLSNVCGIRGAQLAGVGQRVQPAEGRELGAARLVGARVRIRVRVREGWG